MRLVVFGSKGMLGTDVMAVARERKHPAIGYDIDELDITDARQVKDLPYADWVVNCAAYTRVDDAETHRDTAHAINSEGARNLARACAKKRIKLLHVSTDYVFDGQAGRPYVETDQTNPLSVYGTSKLAGEKAVRAEGGHYAIVRTQSLFGVHGHNFVKTIVRKLTESEEALKVVNDQTTSPTYTRHLAEAILRLLEADARGIVHVAASGSCTWFEFARAIADRVRPGADILPAATADLNLPAPRPAYSVLDTRKYRTLTGHVMPTWERGLDAYLEEEGVRA